MVIIVVARSAVTFAIIVAVVTPSSLSLSSSALAIIVEFVARHAFAIVIDLIACRAVAINVDFVARRRPSP